MFTSGRFIHMYFMNENVQKSVSQLKLLTRNEEYFQLCSLNTLKKKSKGLIYVCIDQLVSFFFFFHINNLMVDSIIHICDRFSSLS